MIDYICGIIEFLMFFQGKVANNGSQNNDMEVISFLNPLFFKTNQTFIQEIFQQNQDLFKKIIIK